MSTANRRILFTVCNYNEHQTGSLDKSLTYLSKVKDENVRIVYFDNASRDESEDVLLREYKSGLIDVLLLSKNNMGKAYAMNQMFSHAMSTFRLAPDDILVNMDSDISIIDSAFTKRLRSAFDMCSSIKFISYKYFSDEALTISSQIDNPICGEPLSIASTQYERIMTPHYVGGGLLAMPVSHFTAVGGYNENLGKNGTPAYYGGDDAVLIAKLFKSFQDEIALRCTERMIHHPDTLDTEYKKWKDMVNNNMRKHGFGNCTLPSKGFYD